MCLDLKTLPATR
jgi:hypothetical protein